MEKELTHKRLQGRSQYYGLVCFLSELFNVKLVSDTIIHECIRHLLRASYNEESLECVVALFTISGRYLDSCGTKVKDHNSATIVILITTRSLH